MALIWPQPFPEAARPLRNRRQQLPALGRQVVQSLQGPLRPPRVCLSVLLSQQVLQLVLLTAVLPSEVQCQDPEHLYAGPELGAQVKQQGW